MAKKLNDLIVRTEDPIRLAMQRIDHNQCGLVLVVDDQCRLLSTITDGDIRRAILADIGIDGPLSQLLDRKAHRKPITAQLGVSTADLLSMMQAAIVRQIPILDADQHVVDLITMNELVPNDAMPVKAVIMAGGFGKRLLPLTEETPKPMLPVGEKPLMELIVDQLRDAGINRVDVATHFKSEKIVGHFGDGSRFGVKINYINELLPLGTAGALGLMETPTEPLLVMNGDIFTRVDFRSMLAFHREHKADLTVAVRQYEFQVPFGVLECDEAKVLDIREKPQLRFLVNAGIYLVEPTAYEFITPGKHINMTELINLLVHGGRTVVSFPVIEYWLDIGQHADYQQAQQEAKKNPRNAPRNDPRTDPRENTQNSNRSNPT